MRQLAELNGGDAYVVYTGSDQDDRRICGGAWILEPAGFEGPPLAQGPILEALSPWQSPPPGHGSRFELYERGPAKEVEATELVWVDAKTKLPLRTASKLPSGKLLGRSFLTYDVSPIDPARLAPGLFAVEPTPGLVLDKDVTFHGARPVGVRVDRETGESFEPHYLGTTAPIAGQKYCLATNYVYHLEEEVDATPPSDVGEEPENAIDPAAGSAETLAGASYNRLRPGESCEPGEGSLEPPSLGVISESTAAPTARSERLHFREQAEAFATDPEADPALGGVSEVLFQGRNRPAYAIPDGNDGISVMIVGADVQTIVSGRFEESDIGAIARLLVPQ